MHIHMFSLTPLLWIAVGFVAIQLRHRRKMEALRLRGDRDYTPPPAAGYSSTTTDERRELEALRERVKVLERIATDDRKTHDLAKEIEALRDR